MKNSTFGPDKTVRCAFCGEAYPDGTPTEKHDNLTSHIKECKIHPLNIEIKRLTTPKPIKIKAEPWEDGEYLITLEGQPCGQTVSYKEAQFIIRWLGSAWAELLKVQFSHE